jgi:hypothetical protein
MGSKIITFRVPDDLYDEFGSKCEEEGHTASEKLRQFIDDYLYPPKPGATSPTGESPNEGEESPSDKLEALTLKVEALEEMGDTLGGLLKRVEALENSNRLMGETLDGILDKLGLSETPKVAEKPETEPHEPEVEPTPEAEEKVEEQTPPQEPPLVEAKVTAEPTANGAKEGDNKKSLFDGWLFNKEEAE